jgi:hypothetical protein
MIKIFTISNSRPDFIYLQNECFKKYLKEPFEFTVFNNTHLDAENHHRCMFIDKAIADAGAQDIPIQFDGDLAKRLQAKETSCSIFNGRGFYSNPNVANAYALCWAWENAISKVKGNICLLDSDVFLTTDIMLSSYLVSHDLCYIRQARPGVEYIWNAFVLADLKKLPEPETLDWYCGQINGVPVDVSGQTSQYLLAHPEIPKNYIRPSYKEFDDAVSFSPADYETFWIGHPHIADSTKKFALHYRSGSNWNRRTQEYHEAKTIWLKKQLGL